MGKHVKVVVELPDKPISVTVLDRLQQFRNGDLGFQLDLVWVRICSKIHVYVKSAHLIRERSRLQSIVIVDLRKRNVGIRLRI